MIWLRTGDKELHLYTDSRAEARAVLAVAMKSSVECQVMMEVPPKPVKFKGLE